MARSPARRLLDFAVDAGTSLHCGYRSRRRAFLDYERTPIRDCRMGEPIKVVGRLRAHGPPLSAPLTGVTCLWYRFMAEIDEGDSLDLFYGNWKVGRWWLARKSTQQASPDIFVEDESGAALLHTVNAAMSLVQMRVDWTCDLTPGLGRSVFATNVSAFRSLFAYGDPRPVRYKEVVLREGDPVAVVGRPIIELDPTARGAGFRTPPTRAVFGREPGDAIVSNEPGAW